MFKKHLLFCFCFLPLLALQGQTSPYILGLFPATFEAIEQQLITEEITTLADDCLAIIRSKKSKRIKGIAAFYLGQGAMLEGNYTAAEESYQSAADLLAEASFKKGLALLHTKRGELAFLQGDLFLADSYSNAAMHWAEGERLYAVLTDVYQLRANIFTASQKIDSSFFVLKKASL